MIDGYLTVLVISQEIKVDQKLIRSMLKAKLGHYPQLNLFDSSAVIYLIIIFNIYFYIFRGGSQFMCSKISVKKGICISRFCCVIHIISLSVKLLHSSFVFLVQSFFYRFAQLQKYRVKSRKNRYSYFYVYCRLLTELFCHETIIFQWIPKVHQIESA